MQHNPFFNAHHSPIGAFASFTLGFPGAKGGLGLELGKPAEQNVYIGLEASDDTTSTYYQALPFYGMATEGAEDWRRYEIEATTKHATSGTLLRPFSASDIQRNFQVATDTWSAGDLSFQIISPFRSVPDPDFTGADLEELKDTLVPAVLAELTIDNRNSSRPRRAFFAYSGNDPYSGMRRLDDTLEAPYCGVGQGTMTAIVSDSPGVLSGLGFSLEQVLNQQDPDNLAFALGTCAAMLCTAPAGEKVTFRFAICFYRSGIATAGLKTHYLYTRYFEDIEAVARYALGRFDALKRSALDANEVLEHSKLSDDQKFMLAHAIRSYYGSTELLETEKGKKALWVVNEGEYRMMNTFDLTVDQLFFEMRMSSWTVRMELDLFSERYSYEDEVHFPGDPTPYPGGLSFTHDMGVANVFSRPQYSAYERFAQDGCFSHMTHEQLVNWLCCAQIYVEQTGDQAWLTANRERFERCFQSLLQRDHPDPSKRNGVMGLDSSRTRGTAEITTYDSLDASLGQSRNNIYLASKTWAAYLGLEALFAANGQTELSREAGLQAERCAKTLVEGLNAEGYIPAILGEGSVSRIIPAIEGLAYPLYNGCGAALERGGRFEALLQALQTHLTNVVKPGICLFEDGGWKLSSTSDNSWLSKIYLCQYVARKVFGFETGQEADAAHVAWLLDPQNAYWAWSDQMVSGVALGSRYYPRGVTAILWLTE